MYSPLGHPRSGWVCYLIRTHLEKRSLPGSSTVNRCRQKESPNSWYLDYLWIIVMFLSTVWTLTLTAPLLNFSISVVMRKHNLKHLFNVLIHYVHSVVTELLCVLNCLALYNPTQTVNKLQQKQKQLMAAISLKDIHAGTFNGQEHHEFNGMWKCSVLLWMYTGSSEKRIWPAFWNLVLDENCSLCQGAILGSQS